VFVEEQELVHRASCYEADESIEPESSKHEVHVVSMQKGHIMLDTGCKKSVAGRQWHQDFQKELESLGMKGKEIQATESFRFGDGRVVTSKKTWVYPVGISGVSTTLEICEVDGECPGLLDFGCMTRWRMMFNFQEKTYSAFGKEPKPMNMTSSGHPQMNLLEFEGGPYQVYVLDSEETNGSEEEDLEEEAFEGLDEDLVEILRTTRASRDKTLRQEEVDLESETSESSHVWSTSTEEGAKQ
jgi:hypothetical protein